MELYIAEYQRVFGDKSRLIVFEAPNRATARAVAVSRAEQGELLYALATATEALDYNTTFVNVTYKKHRSLEEMKNSRKVRKVRICTKKT